MQCRVFYVQEFAPSANDSEDESDDMGTLGVGEVNFIPIDPLFLARADTSGATSGPEDENSGTDEDGDSTYSEISCAHNCNGCIARS